MSIESPTATAFLIFTDGACSGNPGPGGWGVVIVSPDHKVTELGAYVPTTTNNRMELSASIHALKFIEDISRNHPVKLCTDSVYVIKGITQWAYGWSQRGWKTAGGDDVANQDLWQELMHLSMAAKQRRAIIEWCYVPGHKGYPGNERVDAIAVAYSKKTPIELYQGPLSQYSHDIFQLPLSLKVPESKTKSTEKAKAYSYLSLVNGAVRRHKNWAECERLVKGVSGAKFKKALSSEDELSILASWGASIDDLSQT